MCLCLVKCGHSCIERIVWKPKVQKPTDRPKLAKPMLHIFVKEVVVFKCGKPDGWCLGKSLGASLFSVFPHLTNETCSVQSTLQHVQPACHNIVWEWSWATGGVSREGGHFARLARNDQIRLQLIDSLLQLAQRQISNMWVCCVKKTAPTVTGKALPACNQCDPS